MLGSADGNRQVDKDRGNNERRAAMQNDGLYCFTENDKQKMLFVWFV